MAIRTRKHQRHSRWAACMVAAMPMVAAAAANGAQEAVSLPDITVDAHVEPTYQIKHSDNPKMTEALLDTPKTVQVISQHVLREQGATSLTEALRNTPGITQQIGENGRSSVGDVFMLRGFSTENSVFVDGVRDLGGVSRDVFNLEQVEVIKGPSGSDSGRGSASGYINLVTKLPSLKDHLSGSLSYGSADRNYLTGDINQTFADGAAFRLNVMRRDGGVPKRDSVHNNSYGIAPSIAFGLNSDTRVYLYSQHMRQNNRPDGGVPAIGLHGYYNADTQLQNAGKVSRRNFYGSTHDFEDVQADMFTVKVEHDLNENTTLRNVSRWGRSSVDRELTGIDRLSTHGSNDPAQWTGNRRRQAVDQANKILTNQTNLSTEFDTAGLRHSLSTGLEFSREQQLQRQRVFPGSVPPANLFDPNAHDPLPHSVNSGAYNRGTTDTAAIYVFDTLHLDEQWSVNGGLRYENYQARYKTLDAKGNAAKLKADDNLLSWNAGIVYKPASNGSVYLSYANSKTPPGNSFTISADPANANNPSTDPQETDHWELGTKWDVLNERLSLTAAVYRTENSNQVTQDDVTLQPRQDGKLRVDGIELGMVGNLTDNWQVSAGIAHMKTKQLNQQNINAKTGVLTQSTGVRWSPENTATLWTTYQMNKLTFGGGARYVGEQARLVTSGSGIDVATSSIPKVPSYWVADAMMGYQVSDNLNVRLNLYNLFNEQYFQVNNSGYRILYGEPRSALLTTEFNF